MCKIVKMKERPFRTEDYSLKLHPVWYYEVTGSSVIDNPQQLAIDTLSGNIFLADYNTNKIHVFDEAGHYISRILTPPRPIGLCLSDEFIFVTTGEQKLVKIQISNKKTVKSVVTEKQVYGIDMSNNIYVCEYDNNSVTVFDKNLNFSNVFLQVSSHFIRYIYLQHQTVENKCMSCFVGLVTLYKYSLKTDS